MEPKVTHLIGRLTLRALDVTDALNIVIHEVSSLL